MNMYSNAIRTFFLLAGFFLLISYESQASECGVMQLQSNRSSGVHVVKNDCIEPPYISVGSIFELSAKGRLWLKSNPSKIKGTEFQMICQNRSGSSLELEFSDMLLPWLAQSKLKNCSGWVDNKLSCDGLNGEKNGFLCVLSFMNPNKIAKPVSIERTTSVKMRNIKILLQSKSTGSGEQKLLQSIKEELELCKKINEIKGGIKISWVVQHENVSDIDITPSNNPILSACIELVIRTNVYSVLEKEEFFNIEL